MRSSRRLLGGAGGRQGDDGALAAGTPAARTTVSVTTIETMAVTAHWTRGKMTRTGETCSPTNARPARTGPGWTEVDLKGRATALRPQTKLAQRREDDADRRDRDADQREAALDQHEAEADRRQRLADKREAGQDECEATLDRSAAQRREPQSPD
jgi:hypothetical protein